MKEDNIEQQHTEETPEKNRVIAYLSRDSGIFEREKRGQRS